MRIHLQHYECQQMEEKVNANLITRCESMYYVICNRLRTKKERPPEGESGAEGVKISPNLSEIFPSRSLLDKSGDVFGNGPQVVGAFCGIHHLGERRDLVGGENVQQRDLERRAAALEGNMVPLRGYDRGGKLLDAASTDIGAG